MVLTVQENDPLKFWQSMQTELPHLSNLARVYLSSPASSTTSEREFKVAKSIQNDQRARLLPKSVETLLFLKYNLRALSYSTNLDAPPSDFIRPNSKSYDNEEESENSQEDEDVALETFFEGFECLPSHGCEEELEGFSDSEAE